MAITNLDTAPETSLTRDGRLYGFSIASWRRPNNTTAYAAGDVIAASTSSTDGLKFPSVARQNGGSGAVLRARVIVQTNYSTPPDLSLFLFNEEPTSSNDNAPIAVPDSELDHALGVINFTGSLAKEINAGAGAAGALIYVTELSNPQAFVCAAADDALYGILVAQSGFTPSAEDKFFVVVDFERD